MLAAIVGSGALRTLDRAVLDIAQLPHLRWLDIVGSVISLGGAAEIGAGLALGLAVARLRYGRGDWWIPLAIALTVIVETLLKLTALQPLPPHELSRNVFVSPGIHVPFLNSYPSGHMARTAFLASVAWIPRPLAIGAVIIMALTRIYMAEHWPSDVVGGTLLGYGVAMVALFIHSRAR